jgi:hypothetical protein
MFAPVVPAERNRDAEPINFIAYERSFAQMKHATNHSTKKSEDSRSD